VTALPFAVSLGMAAMLAPATIAVLRRTGRLRPNYRSAFLPAPTGIALLGASLLTLAALGAAHALGGLEVPLPAPGEAAFVLGVAGLGLLDDLRGSRPGAPRGLRAHARRTLSGRPTTGAAKASGTLLLALLALAGRDLPVGEHVLAAAVLTLATHAFNLLDTRPGRSLKALAVVGAALALGSRDLTAPGALGAFLGPLLVLLRLDLRERGMLGDTGASAAGAVAGLWLVATLPLIGQALALAALAALAGYGELRSIGALVERVPPLRGLDSLGRCR
jgi:UDP-GlcNAc:undecaprenyl-phosphate/decaprenyl-phosphate GlcNAc-1-phosphate transferase